MRAGQVRERQKDLCQLIEQGGWERCSGVHSVWRNFQKSWEERLDRCIDRKSIPWCIVTKTVLNSESTTGLTRLAPALTKYIITNMDRNWRSCWKADDYNFDGRCVCLNIHSIIGYHASGAAPCKTWQTSHHCYLIGNQVYMCCLHWGKQENQVQKKSQIIQFRVLHHHLVVHADSNLHNPQTDPEYLQKIWLHEAQKWP